MKVSERIDNGILVNILQSIVEHGREALSKANSEKFEIFNEVGRPKDTREARENLNKLYSFLTPRDQDVLKWTLSLLIESRAGHKLNSLLAATEKDSCLRKEVSVGGSNLGIIKPGQEAFLLTAEKVREEFSAKKS